MKTVFHNIHLYFSLAAGVIIFCSCVTGTILVFEEEIEHALHHNRYYTEPAGTRLPISQLVFNALKEVPKAKLASVKVYAEANRTVEIGLIAPEKKEEGREQGKPHGAENEKQHSDKPDHQNQKHQDKNSTKMRGKKPENGGGRPNLTVFVDPYTGEITGQFNQRKSFFSTVEMLHRFLLAGKNSIGNTLVAFSTFLFLFILITGVVLWWPKNKKIMRQRLRYKWTGGWKRLTHDLHIVTGFHTSLFLLVIVFTGLIMTFPWANKLLFAIVGSKTASEQLKPLASAYQPGLKPLTVDQILVNNRAEIKDAASYSVRLPQDSAGTFSLNVLPKGAIETAGNNYFIDQFSGKIISIQKFSDKNSGQRARAFVKPIHTGSVYGLPTKIISFIVCVLSLIFPITGVMMWLNRIKKKASKRSTGRYALS